MTAAGPGTLARKRGTVLPQIAAACAVAAYVALSIHPAAAEDPVETAIRGWVASIDASPAWSASYGDLTYDAASGQAVLTGLAIHSTTPGIAVDFGKIAIAGFTATADGGFTASRITADKGSLAVGPFKVALADAEINKFAMPPLSATTWDAEHPFTSMVAAYAPLSRIAMNNGRVGSLTITEENAGVSSRIVYDQFRIDRWADGKIAAITAGPLDMQSPDPDGLVTMKATSFEARDLDLDAALRVFDPTRYAGGVGDEAWHQVIAARRLP